MNIRKLYTLNKISSYLPAVFLVYMAIDYERFTSGKASDAWLYLIIPLFVVSGIISSVILFNMRSTDDTGIKLKFKDLTGALKNVTTAVSALISVVVSVLVYYYNGGETAIIVIVGVYVIFVSSVVERAILPKIEQSHCFNVGFTAWIVDVPYAVCLLYSYISRNDDLLPIVLAVGAIVIAVTFIKKTYMVDEENLFICRVSSLTNALKVKEKIYFEDIKSIEREKGKLIIHHSEGELIIGSFYTGVKHLIETLKKNGVYSE